MNPTLPTRLWFALPGAVMSAIAIAVAAEGPDAGRLLQATLNALGVMLVWSVAVVVHLRYPQRRLGLLLFMLAGAHAVQSLAASSDSPSFFASTRDCSDRPVPSGLSQP